jgi:4-methyl-5(b-hydroxyethyl)-thiazole monophosphate biosynthesis
MERRVLVPVADGSEELETISIVDVLRRPGANVTLASVKDGLTVTGSRGTRLVADCLLSDCAAGTFDLIALPGGMPGAEHLRASSVLAGLLTRQADEGRLYGALCASPVVVLHHHGLLRGRRFTCHHDFAQGFEGQLLPVPVVVDGNLVTGRGAGTAIDFALTLVELLLGRETAQEVRRGMAL